jgi:LPS-assembly protein
LSDLSPLPAIPARANPPAADEIRITGLKQESAGSKYSGRGGVVVETAEMQLSADEMDLDQETGDAVAQGNVRFFHFQRNEVLLADRAAYNLNHQTGTFYNVRGSMPAKIEARPGILTTANAFTFTCAWAERLTDRYMCHEGAITNCRIPNPWWTLRGPEFEIIPGDRAIARKAVFRLRGLPLFYTPYFYKSLERVPRKSGFLQPNIGNSSRRGLMFGGGYYWAINRSYDATYRGQYFTKRGLAHHVDFRGKPTRKSEFNYIFYGVNDKGRPDNTDIKEGGYLMAAEGRADLGAGFKARADFNYLSSYVFRRAFTENFYEAFASQVNSVAYISRHWSSFGLNGLYQSNDVTIDGSDENRISIRKLPSVEFNSRDRLVSEKVLPVWVSFESSASLLRRNQPRFQTRRFVERLDANPRVTTALRWKNFNVVPSVAVRGTHYGSSFTKPGEVVGEGAFRGTGEVALDLYLPSLARVYKTNGWFGPQMKHVIEPYAKYRYLTGVEDFNRIIRFDELDILTNTNQVEAGITNRLYAKRKDGRVDEILSWDLAQQRYFDQSFGGAIIPGTRNMIQTSAEITGFTFFDQARNYSPMISRFRFNPGYGVSGEWQADWDPLVRQFRNSTVQVYGRVSNYALSVGHNQANLPWFKANQMIGFIGVGQDNRPGWSAALLATYDYRAETFLWATTQVSYNTDCCGFNFQWRRFNAGTRQENQFRAALAIANIGSFGSLKRQDRIYF